MRSRSRSRSTFVIVMSLNGRLPDVENINPSSSLRSAHRRLRIDTAAPESGTTCSLFIFIRAAGMVQTAPFRSISDHEASLVSPDRSEEHTSELQSLMRISYAVFCLKKKTIITQ